LLQDKGEFHIENAFSYIGQLDKHAPRLTVKETFDFALNCKAGERTSREAFSSEQLDDISMTSTSEVTGEETALMQHRSGGGLEDMTLKLMGLESVKDNLVSQCSGGQYRRVTVGEMLNPWTSVLCGDEISNGLDASSTYDMVQSLLYVGRFNRLTRIFSLLQPSPETVSLFDEVVVLAEGRLIFAGPVDQVEDYFAAIGYECPSFVDVADFLQLISSSAEDSRALYKGTGPAPSISQLAEVFLKSQQGRRIIDNLEGPHRYLWKENDRVSQHGSSFVSPVSFSEHVGRRYANSFVLSAMLIVKRFLVLWIRDKRVITVSFMKNVIMGVSVGGVFFNSVDPISIQGALFQALLFVVLGKNLCPSVSFPLSPSYSLCACGHA
jgi:ABC-type multidrug transport system ATPase subunit